MTQQGQYQQPSKQPRWIVLAVASGAFAAMNGLFAKLYVNNGINRSAFSANNTIEQRIHKQAPLQNSS